PPHIYTLSLHDALPISVSVLEIRRHAERVNRADDQSALSVAGRAMCERLAKDAPRYSLVVSSPLPRAKETAERIAGRLDGVDPRSEEHTSELQSRGHLV